MSGWWGMVRHPNYLGDLIMALAWSLPCGEWPGWIWARVAQRPSLGMPHCREQLATRDSRCG